MYVALNKALLNKKLSVDKIHKLVSDIADADRKEWFARETFVFPANEICPPADTDRNLEFCVRVRYSETQWEHHTWVKLAVDKVKDKYTVHAVSLCSDGIGYPTMNPHKEHEHIIRWRTEHKLTALD